MCTFIALLHSIVLTSERRVIMEDLRTLAKELGYRDPRTLVSTGNLVFEADGMRPHEATVSDCATRHGLAARRGLGARVGMRW